METELTERVFLYACKKNNFLKISKFLNKIFKNPIKNNKRYKVYLNELK